MYTTITVFALVALIKSILHLIFSYSPAEGSKVNVVSTALLALVYFIATSSVEVPPLTLLIYMQVVLDVSLAILMRNIDAPSGNLTISVRNVLDKNKYSVSVYDREITAKLGKALMPYLILTVLFYVGLVIKINS